MLWLRVLSVCVICLLLVVCGFVAWVFWVSCWWVGFVIAARFYVTCFGVVLICLVGGLLRCCFAFYDDSECCFDC